MPYLKSGGSSVRRSEQVRIDEFPRFFNILQISFVICFPSIQMILGMITQPMTFHQNSFIKRRFRQYIFSNTKKSSPGVIFLQFIQHKRSSCIMWTIIKTEKYFFLLCLRLIIPETCRIKHFQPEGRFCKIKHTQSYSEAIDMYNLAMLAEDL